MKMTIPGQLSLFNEPDIPMMPEEYINTEKEKEWIMEMRSKKYTRKQIAASMNINETKVHNIVKIIRKETNTYNNDHVNEKYHLNEEFLQIIKPNNVLDLFCGTKNFYKDKVENVTSNDIDEKIDADYHMKALKCLCYLYSQDMTYDLIDLDPYGNSCDCFDIAIKMANKGLVITFGESANWIRFKKDLLIKQYYNLSLEDYNMENLIKYVQRIGCRNNKCLIPVFKRNWKGVYRVWFKVETLKRNKYNQHDWNAFFEKGDTL